jgi:hypothetical protein
MSKFKELAAGIKADLSEWDRRADDLMKERVELKKLGDDVFKMHEEKHSEVRSGLMAMKEAVMDLTGGNRPPSEEDSSRSQEPSFRPEDHKAA